MMRRAGSLSNRQGMIPTERFSLIGSKTDFCVDPDDDMVLEAAVNGRAEAVATFNARDFAGVVEEFGIELLTPVAILSSPPTARTRCE
jgi:predicted nucleic acid-binding protein